MQSKRGKHLDQKNFKYNIPGDFIERDIWEKDKCKVKREKDKIRKSYEINSITRKRELKKN